MADEITHVECPRCGWSRAAGQLTLEEISEASFHLLIHLEAVHRLSASEAARISREWATRTVDRVFPLQG